MLKSLRSKSFQEDGFTLVEILVVILIIGILAAIAIPVFLNQRQVAVDASIQSDIKQMINAQMDWVAQNKPGSGGPHGAQMAIREPDSTEPAGTHNTQGIAFTPSQGNYVRVPYMTDADGKITGICIVVWSPRSKNYPTESRGLKWSSVTGKYTEGPNCQS